MRERDELAALKAAVAEAAKEACWYCAGNSGIFEAEARAVDTSSGRHWRHYLRPDRYDDPANAWERCEVRPKLRALAFAARMPACS